MFAFRLCVLSVIVVLAVLLHGIKHNIITGVFSYADWRVFSVEADPYKSLALRNEATSIVEF